MKLFINIKSCLYHHPYIYLDILEKINRFLEHNKRLFVNAWYISDFIIYEALARRK